MTAEGSRELLWVLGPGEQGQIPPQSPLSWDKAAAAQTPLQSLVLFIACVMCAA